MAIADAISVMEVAIGTWQANPSDSVEIAALMAAFNEFSRSVAVQSLALTDDDLRSRVRAHQTFLVVLGTLARQGGTSAPPLADRVRMHADAVLDALAAHVHGTPLPPYRPLPLTDAGALAQALAQWTPTP